MEDGCNSGSDVVNQFTRLDTSGNPVELECYEFAGIRELPDGITGELDGYPDLNDNVRKCPNFANWGCFTGNFTEVEGSQYKTSINKGCSMFDLSGPRDLECTEYDLDNGGTGCKKQCEGNLCNINGMAEPVMCQICSQSLDHTGKERPVLGQFDNDEGCYNMTNDYLSACPIGQTKCMSKLTVDWYVGGDQLLTFERGCMADNDLQTESLSCTEGRSDFVYYKDCTLMCDGNDCNTDKEVELGYTGYDEAGNQKEITCYEYSSNFDYQGPEDVTDIDIEDMANIDARERICPRFANNGCFKGKSTVPQGSIFEGAFPNAFNKGCSMFDLGERPVTCSLLQDEVDTCKHHCTTSYCNEGDMQTVKTQISCQVCSQEVNHVGIPLSGDQGQGSPDGQDFPGFIRSGQLV